MTAELLDALDTFLNEARIVTRERALARLRPALQRELRAAFREQGRLFVEALATIEDNWPIQEATFPGWEALWDKIADFTSGLFTGPIIRSAEVALSYGGESVYEGLGIQLTFDLENPQAVQYIREVGAVHVASISQTTEERLRTVIGDGLEAGWSYDKLARSILDRFDEFAIGRPQKHIDSRAHGIAVTEIGNAYEEGSQSTVANLQQMGLTMEKAWLTVGDSHVDETECLPNQEQGWIPFDQPFQSGDMRPLAHPY